MRASRPGRHGEERGIVEIPDLKRRPRRRPAGPSGGLPWLPRSGEGGLTLRSLVWSKVGMLGLIGSAAASAIGYGNAIAPEHHRYQALKARMAAEAVGLTPPGPQRWETDGSAARPLPGPEPRRRDSVRMVSGGRFPLFLPPDPVDPRDLAAAGDKAREMAGTKDGMVEVPDAEGRMLRALQGAGAAPPAGAGGEAGQAPAAAPGAYSRLAGGAGLSGGLTRRFDALKIRLGGLAWRPAARTASAPSARRPEPRAAASASAAAATARRSEEETSSEAGRSFDSSAQDGGLEAASRPSPAAAAPRPAAPAKALAEGPLSAGPSLLDCPDGSQAVSCPERAPEPLPADPAGGLKASAKPLGAAALVLAVLQWLASQIPGRAARGLALAEARLALLLGGSGAWAALALIAAGAPRQGAPALALAALALLLAYASWKRLSWTRRALGVVGPVLHGGRPGRPAGPRGVWD